MSGIIAAILLILCANFSAQAEIGRMFFTPAQRATLDDARIKNRQIELGTENTPAAEPTPRNVSVNGIVRSSDGKSTVWLNNHAVTGRQADGLNVSTDRNDGRVKLGVPGGGRSVDLKVGQSVEIVSGTIVDNYSRRASVKSEERTLSGAGNPAVTGDKAAASPAGPQEKPAEATQKIESRDRLPSQSVLQRDKTVPSK